MIKSFQLGYVWFAQLEFEYRIVIPILILIIAELELRGIKILVV